MKIGELARGAGTTTKTIRFYEQGGLLPDPPRSASGYRDYGLVDVKRLEFIRKAKRLGLSLEEIKGVLLLNDRDEPTCVHVTALLDEKIRRLEQVVRDLREFGVELLTIRHQAGEMVDCHPTGGNVCGIVERSELTLDPMSFAFLGSGKTEPSSSIAYPPRQ